MYGTSPRSRRSRGSSGDLATTNTAYPPPYTVHDSSTTTNKVSIKSYQIKIPNRNSIIYFQAGNKYAEKGKELLAKVVFYRKSEDKQKLTMDA